MRVCDVCKKILKRDDNWWSTSFSPNSNISAKTGYYYELCANHKNQIIEFIELKIEEATK